MPPPLAPPAPDPSYAQPDFLAPATHGGRCDAGPLAASGSFHVALLDGVTGSGKNRGLFRGDRRKISAANRQVADSDAGGSRLTGQFLGPLRTTVRACVPLEWHSELTPRTPRPQLGGDLGRRGAGRRRRARSALFLPYADLGLIIVDEEHDQALQAG